MVKKVFTICLVFMLCFAAACRKETGEIHRNADSTGNAELNVVTSFGPSDGNRKNYESSLRRFESKYGIKVNDNSEESNERWKSSVRDMFKQKNEPDVLFFFTGADVNELIVDNSFVDIMTIRKQYPEFASQLSVNVLTNMQAVDGNIYAVPVTGYWENMFINQDLFTKYNIPVPTRWEEFLYAVNEFNRVGITPVAASLKEIPHYWFEFMIYNHTGPSWHLHSVPDDPDKIPDSWVSGLEDLKYLYEMGAFPKDTNEITGEQALQMFQNKEAAMLIEGSWKTGQITDIKNVQVVNVFVRDEAKRKQSDMIGGFSMGFYITKKAWDNEEKRDIAVKFVSEMISEESILSFNSGGAASPIVFSGREYENPLLRSIGATQNNATAYIPAVQDTFSFTARTYLFSNISHIVEGDLDIEEALKKFIEYNKNHN